MILPKLLRFLFQNLVYNSGRTSLFLRYGRGALYLLQIAFHLFRNHQQKKISGICCNNSHTAFFLAFYPTTFLFHSLLFLQCSSFCPLYFFILFFKVKRMLFIIFLLTTTAIIHPKIILSTFNATVSIQQIAHIKTSSAISKQKRPVLNLTF